MNGKVIILDGAAGTMLQERGLPLGARPDIFALENPDTAESIHREYIEAGSEIIYANTFGSNSLKLAGTGYDVKTVVTGNINTAKKAAAGTKVKVALDIGPAGELLEPLGTLSFEEAYGIYAEAVRAGSEADLIVIETFTDICDAKAALLAAKENSSLPVYVTMSFEADGMTFTGTSAASAARTLEALGADAVGINCSLGPDEILPVAEEMARNTSLPLVIKPNAGLPDPITGKYGLSAADFSRAMEGYKNLNLLAVGGCCGTSPEYIKAISSFAPADVSAGKPVPAVCSSSVVCDFSKVRTVGERINPTGKKLFRQALIDGDMDYIKRQAIEQADAGADILDVNVGLPDIDEPEMMRRVVCAVQEVSNLPLQIDSSDPAAVEAGLRACSGVAIVNSVNGKEESLAGILPVVKKYGAYLVGLTLDEDGLPDTAEKRTEIAGRIIERAKEYGIDKEKIIIDCLALTVSAQQDQAAQTLRAIREVKEKYGVKTVLGVSNISFGLPKRENFTAAFLSEALACGLDLAIVNPNQQVIMNAVKSHNVITGDDAGCEEYIGFSAGFEKPEKPETKDGVSLEDAIFRGLGEISASEVSRLLKTEDEMDLINNRLIPALNKVGERYEKKEIFLPQLISAANAASAGFEVIKKSLAGKGRESEPRGKIILATVEGDIHDIGKNIVKVVLENYGFKIIDLGKDVPVSKVVETAIAEDVKLVGLSALMSTTVPSMKATIDALRASGHDCKIMVGGAVLTEKSAAEIGADYYGKDAKASADIAQAFFCGGEKE